MRTVAEIANVAPSITSKTYDAIFHPADSLVTEGLDPLVKQADPAINVFWLALSLIIVGSGFLKANISVIVGSLYAQDDPRRRQPDVDLANAGESAIFQGNIGECLAFGRIAGRNAAKEAPWG